MAAATAEAVSPVREAFLFELSQLSTSFEGVRKAGGVWEEGGRRFAKLKPPAIDKAWIQWLGLVA